MRAPEARPIRIANCSGFYGDRLSAAREVVDGGDIDVLTGDYLAELTMLILWKARQRDATRGFAMTFLAQMEEVLGTCVDRGIRVVTNAGGLNPSGLARALNALAAAAGIPLTVAQVVGDDLMPRMESLLADGRRLENLDNGRAFRDVGRELLTANAYLGGWGIAEALGRGADIVITGRVTDASLVVGPAAWWHGWRRNDWDELAGAIAAGHVIECGPQATGGNYSFSDEVVDKRPPGYPIVEVHRDGSSVVTKHPATGGVVSVGTVTAQLLYEIAEPAYQNPDAVAHFESLELTQIGSDRVRIAGTRGSPPSGRLKVAMTCQGGFINTMTLVLTGLDIKGKAAAAERALFAALGGHHTFQETDVKLIPFAPEPGSKIPTAANLRITVKDPDPNKVGRRFSNAFNELSLGGYAGAHSTTPPTAASEYGIYWPTTVEVADVSMQVILPSGAVIDVPHTAADALSGAAARSVRPLPAREVRISRHWGPAVLRPLGELCGARSGDKGGNANVGLWTTSSETYEWLRDSLTPAVIADLVPDATDLEVRRFELPNLFALNFVIVGLLGNGVGGSVRLDPQAKGLGELLLSRYVPIPKRLLFGAAME